MCWERQHLVNAAGSKCRRDCLAVFFSGHCAVYFYVVHHHRKPPFIILRYQGNRVKIKRFGANVASYANASWTT